MKHPICNIAVVVTALLLSFGSMSVITAQSISPNSIPTPRPLDPSTNSTNPSASATQSQNPYLGSVPGMPLQPGVLPLSLKDAVQLALHTNLGLLDAQQQDSGDRAARLRALSTLLPHLEASATQHYAATSMLASDAREIKVPRIVGPVSYEEFGLEFHQSVFDLRANEKLRSADAAQRASSLSILDSRNIVVLAASSAYITIAASESRVEANAAQLDLAKGLEEQMKHRVERGVSPEIDLIRAQVEERTAEQRLDLAKTQFEKDKLALTRIIGLPIEQQFSLTTLLSYVEPPKEDLKAMLDSAHVSRNDLKATSLMVEAAHSATKAASDQRLPTLAINARYAGAGITPAHIYSTYDVSGSVRIPLFTGGEIASEVSAAKALEIRRQMEYRDLEARVQYDVRSAYLDLQGARHSVSVATENLKLAEHGMKEARDRFDVGVSNVVELLQAHQSVAAAQDNYISSVYVHNLAKLMLIRATGTAEMDLPFYLGEK
jgi:outer membrane protein TolC